MTIMKRLLVGLAAVLLLVPVFASAGGAPRPNVVIANPGTQCIAAATEMRIHHKGMLDKTRDRALRQGIRTDRASLIGCVECHASKETGSVIGSGGFCQDCHNYTAVRLDCWQCHQPKASGSSAGVGGVKP